MERPSKFDFYIRFKALFNENGRFIDYILVEVSENFSIATKMNSDRVLGLKLADLAYDVVNPILGLKDFHYHMLPNTKRKFEHYVKEVNRWYYVNLFSDKDDYLMMMYTDISKLKEESIDSYIAEFKNNGEMEYRKKAN